MSYKYKCPYCEKNTFRQVPASKKVTCTHCKKPFSIEYATEEQKETPMLEQQDSFNIPEKEEGTNIKFNVVNEHKEFNKTDAPDIKTPEQQIREESRGMTEKVVITKKLDGSTQMKKTLTPSPSGVWQGETFAKLFSMTDEVMKSKSNSTIWDVSKKEEEKLGELWADVANAYAPEATTKEVKLAVATASTFAVYVPRTIQYLKAYKQSKQKKKTEQTTPLLDGQGEPIETEEYKQYEKETTDNTPVSTPDKDFAEQWKNKGAG